MRIIVVCSMVVIVATVTVAQGPVPISDEFLVNSYTTGTQIRPNVAVGSAGEFVVVWEARLGGAPEPDPSYSVQGRRFAADGSPIGDDFQVNTHTTDRQGYPVVDKAPNGDFVVAWASGTSFTAAGQDGSYGGIFAQRYAADATPLGGEFPVNTYTTGWQHTPALAFSPSGESLITWTSPGSTGPDQDWSIQGQRYDANGNTIGSEFQLNSHTSGIQGSHLNGLWGAHADFGPNGEQVAVWRSESSPGDDSLGSSVVGRRFAADGDPIGNDFQINTWTFTDQFEPRVTIGPEGDFVVVWASKSGADDSSNDSVQAQRFTSDGSRQGNQFQVNSWTTVFQRYPSVDYSPQGQFMVTWSSGSLISAAGGPDGSFFGVQAQQYSADGSPIGGEFQVNTFTNSSQFRSSVAASPDGIFTVVWESSNSGAPDFGPAILGQRYSTVVFADGFEDGDPDLPNWSSHQP